jgi:hypothetical protein
MCLCGFRFLDAFYLQMRDWGFLDFMQRWRLDLDFVFRTRACKRTLIPPPPYLFTVDTTRSALIWGMCSISSGIAH